LVGNLRQELQALGIWEALEDPATTDVMLNENGSVYVATHDGLGRLPHRFEPERLESAIGTLAALHGLEAHRDRPLLEATLPFGAVRAQASLPPVVVSPTLTLRKPPARLMTLEELVSRGTLTADQARELADAFAERANLVIAGGVGSGKTTLATALLDDLLCRFPEERILTIEEGARELQPSGENVTRLLTHEAAGIDTRRLVRHALRSNPDRIILGEARGAEAHDFLKAANTGHPGALLTLHANGPEDALHRLDSLVQEAGVPSQMERIRQTVDWVVYMKRRGVRRVVVGVGRVEPPDTAEGA
jgi:type IV secretion system protein VirB11